MVHIQGEFSMAPASWLALLLPASSAGAAAAPVLHGCLNANTSAMAFCDTSLSHAARARDLRERLTLHEKVCLMNASPSSHQSDNCSGAVPRLGLPAYNWAIEDLHGAGTACLNTTGSDGATAWHCPTIFPTLNVLAASFNDSVWYGAGEVIGVEVRAANNAGATRARHADPGEHFHTNPRIGVSAWGPNLNIARDARWGRNTEVPSEDPLLAGKVGAAMTRGIQGQKAGAPQPKYITCLGALKHVTAYSLENWRDDTGGPNNGTAYNRMGFDATIARRDMAETYLEQFRIAMTEAEPLGMMCSYTAINGSAACENGHLLTTWARGSQGFQGNVITDCGALKMPSEPKDHVVSAAAALNAGTDVDCGAVFSTSLLAALASNQTAVELLDASVERSFGLLMRAGYFDPLEDLAAAGLDFPPQAMGTAASHALARDAALQGLVLLRNEAPNPPKPEAKALPLRRGVKTAVLGPLANITLLMMARYYDAVCAGPLNTSLPWSHGERPSGCIVSPLAAITAHAGAGGADLITHASGIDCPDDRPGSHCLQSDSTAGFASATAAAADAEQVVVFVGIDEYDECEGKDRQQLELPGAQPALLAAIRAAVKPGVPVVVVVLNGGAIAMDYAGVADAVVEAFFPGIEGADAIACALFGDEGCNRFGRLPVTVMPASFKGNDMANMGVSTGGSGLRTYKYYDGAFGAPLFEFGWGLSYTQWRTVWAAPPPAAPGVVSPTASVELLVTTTNDGDREGDQVVMLYHYPRTHAGSLRDLAPGTPLPQRKLVAYRRVSLPAGASTTIKFTVTAESLALIDNEGDAQLLAGTHELRAWQGNGKEISRNVEVKETALLRKFVW